MKELERRLERLEGQAAEPRAAAPDLPDSDAELAAKIIGLATRLLGAAVWAELGFEGTPSESEVIARTGVLAVLSERL